MSVTASLGSVFVSADSPRIVKLFTTVGNVARVTLGFILQLATSVDLAADSSQLHDLAATDDSACVDLRRCDRALETRSVWFLRTMFCAVGGDKGIEFLTERIIRFGGVWRVRHPNDLCHPRKKCWLWPLSDDRCACA
jgi:hypothetical protein